MEKRVQIAERIIERGHQLLTRPYEPVKFTGNEQADMMLNDLENYPHAIVLSSVMDRQIKAERAWLIPYQISEEIGGFEFSRILKWTLPKIKEIFDRKKLHRFNETMSVNFYNAVQLIHNQYRDDASTIWKDNPKSATIVRRFLEFDGVGVKIATMLANILARDFKIPMQDKICIDISPDTQVMKVFKRIGFIENKATIDQLLYCARELNPEYPGIFDFTAWEIGRNWCKSTDPECEKCYLDDLCPKILRLENTSRKEFIQKQVNP